MLSVLEAHMEGILVGTTEAPRRVWGDAKVAGLDSGIGLPRRLSAKGSED